MRGAAFSLWIAMALSLCAATGTASPRMGTEQEPEITDPENNVRYSAFYTGARDRHHLDIVAAWVEHHPHNDTIQATMKTKQMQDLSAAGRDWIMVWRFNANLTVDGQKQAQLQFWSQKDPTLPNLRGGTLIHKENGQRVEVPGGFSVAPGEPGLFRWFAPLSPIKQWGSAAEQFHAESFEQLILGGSLIATGITNSNPTASSGASFDLDNLRPASVATEPSDAPMTGTSSSDVSAGEQTRALGALAVLGIVLALAWRRRQHP